mgnify:CR=1 FL=1
MRTKSAEPGTPIEQCDRCGGQGVLQAVTRSPFGQVVRTVPCDQCNGDGRIPQTPCDECDGEGRIRAFLNFCPHRGATVCREASGNARAFVCPYHGWAFKPDGQLLAIPAPERYPAEFADYESQLNEYRQNLEQVQSELTAREAEVDQRVQIEVADRKDAAAAAAVATVRSAKGDELFAAKARTAGATIANTFDTDNDGMPDDFERRYDLDPNVQDHNGSQLSIAFTGVAGYTNLECYLNHLSDKLIVAQHGLERWAR